MDFVVFTSKNRKLPLPLLLKDTEVGEEILATNAPHGMLLVVSQTLKSYFLATSNELEQGSLVCVPLIDDFKELEKKKLANHLEKLNKL